MARSPSGGKMRSPRASVSLWQDGTVCLHIHVGYVHTLFFIAWYKYAHVIVMIIAMDDNHDFHSILCLSLGFLIARL